MLSLERSYKTSIMVILTGYVFISFAALALFEGLLPKMAQWAEHHLSYYQNAEQLGYLLSQLQVQPAKEPHAQLLKTCTQLAEHLSSDKELQLLNHLCQEAHKPPPWSAAQFHTMLNLLNSLGGSNRLAMLTGFEDIKRLWLSRAWIIELLTTLGLLAALFFTYKLKRQVIEPVGELCRGLQDWRRGNQLRRMKSLEGAEDIREAMQTVNELLDQKL